MLNAKFLLLYSALAAGVWGASYGGNQWLVLLQVVCAVIISVSIFLAVFLVGDTSADSDIADGSTPIAIPRHH
jgi:hypothetical protein